MSILDAAQYQRIFPRKNILYKQFSLSDFPRVKIVNSTRGKNALRYHYCY